MFDRFTHRSRKVMGFARQEAERFNHDYIGTEHILLGLLKEGSGVAANVLKNFDVALERVRNEVEGMVGPKPDIAPMSQLPFTPRAEKVLTFAMEEAKQLDHNYVGTEHLLLGLLRENEGTAAQVLMNLGLKLDEVRAEIMELLGADERVKVTEDDDSQLRKFERLSPETGKSIFEKLDLLTAEIAQDYKYNKIVAEHVLLALLKYEPILFYRLLEASTITLDQFRQRIVESLREKFGDE